MPPIIRALRADITRLAVDAIVASCYRRAIEIAAENGIATLAFPSISTGVYGYPIELAAQVAVGTVRTSLLEHPSIEEVIFCCFSADDLRVYEGILGGGAV